MTNKQAYRVMKEEGLLHKRRPRAAALYQASKLWELLPQKPNDLWQMDVTYVHIPGHGWWYAVTVIDYYSRYLLALRLTSSYCALEAVEALREARAEAERIHGPLAKTPFLVTDNGSSFVARRFGAYIKERYAHVRIQYRTPTQLGLLERFHETLKEEEEVYWRLYQNPPHARECLGEFRLRYNTRRPHWALRPAEGGDPYVPEEVYAQGRTIQIPKWQSWAVKAKAELDRRYEEAAHVRRALSWPILAAPPVRPRRSVGGFRVFFLRVTDRQKSLTKTAQPIPLEFGAKTAPPSTGNPHAHHRNAPTAIRASINPHSRRNPEPETRNPKLIFRLPPSSSPRSPP